MDDRHIREKKPILTLQTLSGRTSQATFIKHRFITMLYEKRGASEKCCVATVNITAPSRSSESRGHHLPAQLIDSVLDGLEPSALGSGSNFKTWLFGDRPRPEDETDGHCDGMPWATVWVDPGRQQETSAKVDKCPYAAGHARNILHVPVSTGTCYVRSFASVAMLNAMKP